MDPKDQIRALQREVDSVRSQLRNLQSALAAVGVVVLLVLVGLSLWGPAFHEVYDDGDKVEDGGTKSLAGLPGQASDAENGAVQLFAVLTILTLLALVVAVLVMLGGSSVVPCGVAVSTLLVVWIGLRVVVGASGEQGYIGDLGVAAAAGAWWPVAAAAWAGGGAYVARGFRAA